MTRSVTEPLARCAHNLLYELSSPWTQVCIHPSIEFVDDCDFCSAMASEEEMRARILEEYFELRQDHPALPAHLRDFQVGKCSSTLEHLIFDDLQVDILCSVLDRSDQSNILVALPTGYGKSLPLLLLGLLRPEGRLAIFCFRLFCIHKVESIPQLSADTAHEGAHPFNYSLKQIPTCIRSLFQSS